MKKASGRLMQSVHLDFFRGGTSIFTTWVLITRACLLMEKGQGGNKGKQSAREYGEPPRIGITATSCPSSSAAFDPMPFGRGLFRPSMAIPPTQFLSSRVSA